MIIPNLVEALEISTDELFGFDNKQNLLEQGSTDSGISSNKQGIKGILNSKERWQVIFIYSMMMTIARFIEVLLNTFLNFYFCFELVGISILGATCIIAYKQVKNSNSK